MGINRIRIQLTITIPKETKRIIEKEKGKREKQQNKNTFISIQVLVEPKCHSSPND
jgi:hypothetical protein